MIEKHTAQFKQSHFLFHTTACTILHVLVYIWSESVTFLFESFPIPLILYVYSNYDIVAIRD